MLSVLSEIFLDIEKHFHLHYGYYSTYLQSLYPCILGLFINQNR